MAILGPEYFYKRVTTAALEWDKPRAISSRFWGLGGLVPMNHGSEYFWVVLCKNRGFHHKETLSYVHQIPLGETDAFSCLPMLPQSFEVRCDRCSAEYSYKAQDVLRNEIQLPEDFVPHPLFR